MLSMKGNKNKISNILQQVRLLKNKYDKLAAATGEDFNIFSILRIKRREVITHTPMLAELLDPHGSHRQGAAFLKRFLEICIKDQEYTDLETFRVRSEERTDRGQFDILIEKEKETCIVIENKIYAGDQPHQLNNYYQDAKGNEFNQIKLIYLTLDGSEPDEKSLKAVNGQGNDLSIDDVILISYGEHIIKWLEVCMKLKGIQRIAPIREILSQYRDLLKQLTGQSTNTRYSMDLTDILVRDENYELIPDLENMLLEYKVHLQLVFWEELAKVIPQKVDNCGIHDNQEKQASEDNIRHYYQGSRNRLYIGTTFKLGSFSWKQTEIALRVELGEGSWIYYGFILLNENGDRVDDCRDNRFDTLAAKLLDNDFKRTKWWIGWKYPARNVIFPLDYSGQNRKYLQDHRNRRESVQELVTEIAATVAQLKKNLN